MNGAAIGRVALLWRGDLAQRAIVTRNNNRWRDIFAALATRGVEAEPVVYCEEAAVAVRDQLLGVDGVLVWVNPIQDGRTRFALDAVLREVAERGIWVSTHPDVTRKIGVKEVLHATRHLGWGTDTRLYRDVDDFRSGFPSCLADTGPRVLKQNRGNGGQGVWKVERAPGDRMVTVLEALRGSVPETLPLADFMTRCEVYFADDGCIVDQPFQARLPDGMIRCYLGGDRVVGFGHQLIKALIPPPPTGPDSPEAEPGPRIMCAASEPRFHALRAKMEQEWVPQMMQHFGLTPRMLPIIWDADFLYGPRDADGADSYVLCEINVSSVMPIPDQAPAAIARLVEERLHPPRA